CRSSESIAAGVICTYRPAMRCFYSDTFVLPLPADHRFPWSKYSGLRQALLPSHVVSESDLFEAPQASWEELALVHTPEYLAAVGHGSLAREAQRRIGFPWSPEMVERSRRSVGATIAAARAAVFEASAANLAGGTHHAFADRGEGYCVLNDVAVATRVLQRDGAARRVLVVDCDVHQGNGTAAIFAGDPDVFTFSMHAERNIPTRKETSSLDVGLPDGCRDEEYLAALERTAPAALDRHAPDLVLYQA